MKNRYVRLLCLLLSVTLLILGGVLTAAAATPSERQMVGGQVYLGGMPFGVKFNTEGVMVVGFCDIGDAEGQSHAVNPAKDAGIRLKDVITHVNGTPLAGAEDLTRAVENSGGQPLSLTIRRHATASSTTRAIKMTKITPKPQAARCW